MLDELCGQKLHDMFFSQRSMLERKQRRLMMRHVLGFVECGEEVALQANGNALSA